MRQLERIFFFVSGVLEVEVSYRYLTSCFVVGR